MYLWFTTNRFFVIKNPTKASELHDTRQICNLKSIDKLPFREICSESKKPFPFSAPYEYNIIRPECFVSSETKTSPKIPSVVIKKDMYGLKGSQDPIFVCSFLEFCSHLPWLHVFSIATVLPVFEAFLDEHAALWTIVGWPKKFGQEILRCLL